MARERGVNDADVDDIAQDAVVALIRSLRCAMDDRGIPARRLLLWVLVRDEVARRKSQRARFEKLIREITLGNVGQFAGNGRAPSIEAQIIERAPLIWLQAAVDKLRTEAPELHEVLQGQLEGIPLARIAATLEIPLGTACTRARRARQALCAQVRGRMPEVVRVEKAVPLPWV